MVSVQCFITSKKNDCLVVKYLIEVVTYNLGPSLVLFFKKMESFS